MLTEIISILVIVSATLQADNTEGYYKPIMYGSAIVVVVVSFAVISFIYGMTHEKDPMIYSKYLTVKKSK